MALYRRWAPVAWSEMVASLPAEADSPEVDELAEEEFRRRLAGALTRLVQLRVRAGEDQDEAPQSRALIDWCRWYARSERWARVRSHRAWGALAPGDGLAATRLRVAIRAEVLTQIGAADLAHLGQRRLAQLCELYGVGQRVRVSHGGTHAVELDPEWVAELLAPEGST
jgi:hypothetical protein